MRCALQGPALHFGRSPAFPAVPAAGLFFQRLQHEVRFLPKTLKSAGSVSAKTFPLRAFATFFWNCRRRGVEHQPCHPQPLCAKNLWKPARRKKGLHLPVVYNSSCYELPETLALLRGLVDIYLPDLKYVSAKLSARYSGAPDYFAGKGGPCRNGRAGGEGPFDKNGIAWGRYCAPPDVARRSF